MSLFWPFGKPKPVHVAFAADEKYLLPLTVAARSLCENFRTRRPLHLHVVLCGNIKDESLGRLKDSLAGTDAALELLFLDNKRLSGLSAGLHFSPAAYARLFLPELLPGLAKVVYLDSDTLVLSDIAALYDLDPGQQILLAAPDWTGSLGNPIAKIPESVLVEMGLRADTYAYNSGVLLFHLDAWREQKLTEKVVHFAKNHPEALQLVDQNAINLTLSKQIGELDPRWNKQFPHSRVEEWKVPVQRHPWDPAKILHFTSEEKPWLPGCKLPEAELYRAYWRRTKWPLV